MTGIEERPGSAQAGSASTGDVPAERPASQDRFGVLAAYWAMRPRRPCLRGTHSLLTEGAPLDSGSHDPA
jgi:hypothetical protein